MDFLRKLGRMHVVSQPASQPAASTHHVPSSISRTLPLSFFSFTRRRCIIADGGVASIVVIIIGFLPLPLSSPLLSSPDKHAYYEAVPPL